MYDVQGVVFVVFLALREFCDCVVLLFALNFGMYAMWKNLHLSPCSLITNSM